MEYITKNNPRELLGTRKYNKLAFQLKIWVLFFKETTNTVVWIHRIIENFKIRNQF